MSRSIIEHMSNLVIATTTYYKLDNESDLIRYKLSLQMFTKAKSKGYEVVVVDGGSSSEIITTYNQLGVHVFSQKDKGIGNSRREAIVEAQKLTTQYICWTEPEKVSLIESLDTVVEYMHNNNVDIIIPKRSSLSSYPLFQQKEEELLNMFWNNLTGKDFDICFGPRVFRKELSSYFLDYKGKYGDKWDSIFIPVINVLFDNKKVESIPIDYIHPSEQTAIEQDNIEFDRKRIEQLASLTNICYLHWRKLHKS